MLGESRPLTGSENPYEKNVSILSAGSNCIFADCNSNTLPEFSNAFCSVEPLANSQLLNAESTNLQSHSNLLHFERVAMQSDPLTKGQLSCVGPPCSYELPTSHFVETNSLSEESELQLHNSSLQVVPSLPACSLEPLKHGVEPSSSFELHTSLLIETFSPLEDLESQRINLLHSTGSSSTSSSVAFNPSSLFVDFNFFDEVDHFVEEDFVTKDSPFNPITSLCSHNVVNEIFHAAHST